VLPTAFPQGELLRQHAPTIKPKPDMPVPYWQVALYKFTHRVFIQVPLLRHTLETESKRMPYPWAFENTHTRWQTRGRKKPVTRSQATDYYPPRHTAAHPTTQVHGIDKSTHVPFHRANSMMRPSCFPLPRHISYGGSRLPVLIARYSRPPHKIGFRTPVHTQIVKIGSFWRF